MTTTFSFWFPIKWSIIYNKLWNQWMRIMIMMLMTTIIRTGYIHLSKSTGVFWSLSIWIYFMVDMNRQIQGDSWYVELTLKLVSRTNTGIETSQYLYMRCHSWVYRSNAINYLIKSHQWNKHNATNMNLGLHCHCNIQLVTIISFLTRLQSLFLWLIDSSWAPIQPQGYMMLGCPE